MFVQRIAHRMLLFGMLSCAAAGSASVSFRAAVKYHVGTNPTAVAVGDFNGDRKPDLAVVNAGDASVNDPGGISILLGNGDGTFQAAKNFSDGNNPTAIAAGDFNGDGNDDLVLVRLGDPTGTDKGDVVIFLSNGDGTFRTGQALPTIPNPTSVIATDLDSNGSLDLAITDWTADAVAIFLGQGDGTFQAGHNLSIQGVGPKQIRQLDFDHDGKKDLAATGRGPIEVLLGNGDGTFQAAFPLGTFNSGESPDFVADFNHDSNVDVLVTGCNPFNGCAEFLLLNNGNGTFAAPPGTNALQVGVDLAGDFDGDGNFDLLGPVSGNGGKIQVFTGNGDGSFQTPVIFPGSAAFRSLPLAADLNGDKAADFVIANSDGTISVILNSGTDFSLSASPLIPDPIGTGQSASSTLNLQLVSLFNNPVSLTCSVQPVQPGAPTCSLSSNSVSFDSTGKAVATLTIAAGALAQLHSRPMEFAAILWLPLVGFAFLSQTAWSRTAKQKVVLLFGFTTLLGLVSLSACGGGTASRGGATNYSVTVTGTSAQTQHATTLNLTVK